MNAVVLKIRSVDFVRHLEFSLIEDRIKYAHGHHCMEKAGLNMKDEKLQISSLRLGGLRLDSSTGWEPRPT